MNRRILFLAIVLAIIVGLSAEPSTAAERVERTLNYEVAIADTGALHFENLIGSMTVRADTTHGMVLVEALVVAEAESWQEAKALTESFELAAAIENERSVIRVAYPVDRHTAFRLPKSEKDGLLNKWVTPLIRKSTVATVYDGQTVEVGQTKGATAIAVHVKVTLPLDVDASCRQVVGPLHAIGVRGNFKLEVIEGQVMADQAYGSLQVRTGGGEVIARKFGGEEFRLQTGTGDITMTEVKADSVTLLTGSGRIEGTGITADSLEIDSGVGGVFLEDVDSVALQVASDSGAVDVAAKITRTREASIKSKVGDVTLRVSRATPFELKALSDSGSVKHRDLSAEILDMEKNAVHLQRGQGGATLEVSTGKGEVMIRAI